MSRDHRIGMWIVIVAVAVLALAWLLSWYGVLHFE